MTGPCLSTADPCASFAAPLCEGQWQVMRRKYNALLLEQHKGPVALVVDVGPVAPPDRPALPVDIRSLDALLPRGADDMLGGWWPRG